MERREIPEILRLVEQSLADLEREWEVIRVSYRDGTAVDFERNHLMPIVEITERYLKSMRRVSEKLEDAEIAVASGY